MIYIQTWAYNAEKTLDRTIKSVLGQTYPNFIYYILDNGSADHTGKIIEKYAANDNRIKAYHSKKNNDSDENSEFWNLTKRIPEGDYYCILDADDTYEPNFFEEMIHFAEKNQLGVVACGSMFREETSEKVIDRRVLERTLILKDQERLDAFFPAIYWNLRQAWGKLYSSRAAAARMGAKRPGWLPVYGGDTVIALESVKAAGSIGIYSKALHNYFVSPKSYSYRWDPKRVEADAILYNKGKEFLLETCGWISDRNQKFLYGVYYNAIKDTIAVLLHSDLELSEKLITLRSILSNRLTRQMFQEDMTIFGECENTKKELFQELSQWLEKQASQYTLQNIAALKAVYVQFNPAMEQLMTEEELLLYIQQMPRIITAIAGGDYLLAAEDLRKVSWKSIDQIFPITLAQTIAALLDDQEAYISYEKILIEKLIQVADYTQAEQELSEWEQLLPEDKELKKLRRCLR